MKQLLLLTLLSSIAFAAQESSEFRKAIPESHAETLGLGYRVKRCQAAVEKALLNQAAAPSAINKAARGCFSTTL